ncbi:putative interferon-induced 6-16 family protein [Lyophyllum shimeji]|uniref:Interferon-induced 6-16 family protein n=1 Tax=Lyophyllum shimeji TaxID=47721 RepID=A0A9P3ULP1_LYOSH|nr:putative interferon-induced 6-16 family protein [Lyophyllum shimeji]
MRLLVALLALFAFVAAVAASPSPQGLSFYDRLVSWPFNRLLSDDFDFWASAKALGHNITMYAEKKLHDLALEIPAASTQLDNFKETMSSVITTSQNLRGDIERHCEDGITLDDISRKLSSELAIVFENLKAEFSLPLPEDHNVRYEEREKMIDWLLDEVEHALVSVLPIPEADTRRSFQEVRPHIKHVILITGQLVDNHPGMFEMILFSGAALLIPESWLLRPVLSLFGFGPYGPVKHSPAAWAQRRFFGGAVTKDSWFSMLQSAGAKVISPGIGKKILGSIGLGAGIVATLKGCGTR